MRLLYYIIYAIWYVVSLLPLRVLYILSDGIYLLLYRCVGYRLKVVRKNLAASFPEKTEEELRKIERGFYHYLCDYFVEMVKLRTMSERQLRRRMVFKGMEAVNKVVEDGQSCAVYLGHYGNWEWITSLALWTSGKAQCAQIYHPLENKEMDRLTLSLRERFGGVCIPMTETLRYLVRLRSEGRPTIVGYIADQVPFWRNMHHWRTFLSHPQTPVLSGTENIARRMDNAVFYLDVRRVRRGYYEAEFKLITRTPKDMPEFALTDAYFDMLEATIRRAPEFWLWSHNRWKRTKEEFLERFYVVGTTIYEYQHRQPKPDEKIIRPHGMTE
ncbi:MAG: lysophospholipid acyltransferase family protein [Prevotella sp.]|nr:lysophospholipid acyltransferase family protein [Prevotella sp.]